MPTLISSINTQLATDFAMLSLHQLETYCELNHSSFVHSDESGVFMSAGSRFPTLRVISFNGGMRGRRTKWPSRTSTRFPSKCAQTPARS
jgi:hypothetical protein